MENCFLSIHHASLMVHLEISWFTAAIIMLRVGEMAIGSGDTPPTPHLAAPTAKLYQERTFVKNQIGTREAVNWISKLQDKRSWIEKVWCSLPWRI
jgi:hypothetical protein